MLSETQNDSNTPLDEKVLTWSDEDSGLNPVIDSAEFAYKVSLNLLDQYSF